VSPLRLGYRALVDAYAHFIDEAMSGRFRAPVDGGPTAEQIVARVARTHEKLIEVTEALLAGDDDVHYDNTEPTVRQLERYVAGYGGLAGLADRVAMTVTVLRDLAYRLEERGAVRVPVTDGDPMPWAKVLELDETVQVPRRLGQLRALRSTAAA
jgi:hypothetical protein